MLLVVQTHVVPAITGGERGCFGSLLITVFFTQVPVGCFYREYGDSRFVEDLGIVTTSGSFRIVFVQARVGTGDDTAAVCNCQRPVARQFSYCFRGSFPTIEVELIPDDQVIEVDNQQCIFLLCRTHAFKDIFCTKFAFFLTAGGDKPNAVLCRYIFKFFSQLQHDTQTCGVIVDALQG